MPNPNIYITFATVSNEPIAHVRQKRKEIVVFRKISAVIAHYFQILIYHFYIPSNFELDIRL